MGLVPSFRVMQWSISLVGGNCLALEKCPQKLLSSAAYHA